jgi:hypothetical protein
MQIPLGWRLVQEAPNGVRHYHAARLPESKRGGDIYELPAGQDGVARTITCVKRRWWRGGDRWKAEDGQGRSLGTSRWEYLVTTTDAATGLTTRLDTRTLQIQVSTPLLTETKPLPYGTQHIDRRALCETIEPDGRLDVISNSYTRTDRTVHKLGAAIGARPTVTDSEHHHDHTRVSAQGVVEATIENQRFLKNPVSMRVEAQLGADGTLRIENDVVHLPIAPAAIAQRQNGLPAPLNEETMKSAGF